MRKGNSGAHHKRNPAPKTPPLPRDTRAPTITNMVLQTEQSDSSPLGTEQFSALMQAITGCQTTLMAKIEQMQKEIGLVRRDMDKFRDRLSEVERRVGDTEDMIREHDTSLHTLQLKMKAMESWAEDQKN